VSDNETVPVLPPLDHESRLYRETLAQPCSFCGRAIPPQLPRWVYLWDEEGAGEVRPNRLHRSCSIAVDVLNLERWTRRDTLAELDDERLAEVLADMPLDLRAEWLEVSHG
jgi:hypothetical protein